MVNVEHLVKEAAHMEAEPASLLFAESLRVFVFVNPSALRKGEFELVAVICSLVRRHDRGYFRYLEMPYAHELVIYLLLLGLKLHFIRKWLPFASSAYSEMAAERLQTMR